MSPPPQRGENPALALSQKEALGFGVEEVSQSPLVPARGPGLPGSPGLKLVVWAVAVPVE